MNKITIENESTKISLDINAIDNPTTKEISRSLPIESKVSMWGDEIYFDIGIHAPEEGATLDVNVGDIAYWAQGQCLCIFFRQDARQRYGQTCAGKRGSHSGQGKCRS